MNRFAIPIALLGWSIRKLAIRMYAYMPEFCKSKVGALAILPAMSGLEYAFLRALMRQNKDCIYIEYGCGGSTLLADKYFSNIISADTDMEWCDRINTHLKNGQVRHIDVGETSDWGAPIEMSELNARKIAQIHQNVLLEAKSHHARRFILIDGRCRVFTACSIFPHITDGDIVLLHDFTTRREYYDILQMYDLAIVYGNLALLRKHNAPACMLHNIADSYRCDFR